MHITLPLTDTYKYMRLLTRFYGIAINFSNHANSIIEIIFPAYFTQIMHSLGVGFLVHL